METATDSTRAEETREREEREEESQKRKQTFYAVVTRFAGPEMERPTVIVEASNRTLLRKALAEDMMIAEILAIFRGHKLEFQTKKNVEFC